MSMTEDMIRRMQADDARLRQTETKEVPGGIPGFTSFYDVGTWTPVFTGTGTAGVFTYVAQLGIWTRIGDQVFIHAYIQISAIGTPPTGNMRITGLPFTSGNVGMDYSLALGYVSAVNVTADIIQLTAHVSLNAAHIALFEMFDNVASGAYPAANFTNVNAAIDLSGSYRV